MSVEREEREAKMRAVLGLEAEARTPAPDLAGDACTTPCAERGLIAGFFHKLACRTRRWFRSFGRAQPYASECPSHEHPH